MGERFQTNKDSETTLMPSATFWGKSPDVLQHVLLGRASVLQLSNHQLESHGQDHEHLLHSRISGQGHLTLRDLLRPHPHRGCAQWGRSCPGFFLGLQPMAAAVQGKLLSGGGQKPPKG